MYGRKFNAEIQGITPAKKEEKQVINIKAEVILEYPDIQKLDEKIYSTLELHEYPCFSEMKVNAPSAYGLKCYYEMKVQEQSLGFDEDDSSEDNEYCFQRFTIPSLICKIKDGKIPSFIFTFCVPAEWCNISSLYNHFKTPIVMSFEKVEVESDNA